VSAVKVLLVDDSAVVRQVLTAVLDRDPGITVTAAVSDPLFAMERMKADWPDVVVLDVEMPRMDGITFLRKIMSVRPTPVVICSTLTERGAETTMQAMAAGAVAFVCKPHSGLKTFLEEDAGDIVRTVRSAAAGDVRRLRASPPAPTPRTPSAVSAPASATPPAVAAGAMAATTDRLVAIGTSTGGTQALEHVLTHLPRVSPGIVVVQHMPELFTAAFAARLNSVCEAEVAEARDGERVLPGRILLAPGGRHMAVERDGAQYRVRVTDGPRVNRHKPSVDVLFQSVATCAGANALGVIMTGMGDDGARGLKEMRDAGARTVGQDEATCVVYGMPQAAKRLGGVERELALGAIPGAVLAFAGR
jgi:two-component system chemotaxis response regulator CheB